MLVVGYVIQALEAKQGIVFAIGISVLIRLLYHTYQGPIAAISIIPMGLIFAVVFWRWRNVVPLIVAHTIMNGLALSSEI
jgi:membrane protease YdiL (CAAX protease family)